MRLVKTASYGRQQKLGGYDRFAEVRTEWVIGDESTIELLRGRMKMVQNFNDTSINFSNYYYKCFVDSNLSRNGF